MWGIKEAAKVTPVEVCRGESGIEGFMLIVPVHFTEQNVPVDKVCLGNAGIHVLHALVPGVNI